MTADQSFDIARRFARLLDQEAFNRLEELLHPDCTYLSPQGTLHGSSSIVDSYRRNATWAHATFDRIEWESELAAEPDGRFRITFTDFTTHAGIEHRYRCQQLVRVDVSQRIDNVEHVAIEEEERALAAFFRRVGVER